jgi:hypothetical protein
MARANRHYIPGYVWHDKGQREKAKKAQNVKVFNTPNPLK